MKVAQSVIKEIRFNELFESLSVNGKVDKNTLKLVLLMLSTGDLEERLDELFSLIPSGVAADGADGGGSGGGVLGLRGRRAKKKVKKKVTRTNLIETGQIALTCLVMMNLSLRPLNGAHFKLALFDPHMIMLVGKSQLDRAVSDVCDVHLLASYDEVPIVDSANALVGFDEFVQICLNVFYNLVESSTMKIAETPLRSRSDPVLRRYVGFPLSLSLSPPLSLSASEVRRPG